MKNSEVCKLLLKINELRFLQKALMQFILAASMSNDTDYATLRHFLQSSFV